LGCAAPAALVETIILQMMVAMSADAEELARLHLAHRRIVNLNRVRY